MTVKRATLREIYRLFGRKTGDLILNEEQRHYICWDGDVAVGYTAIREFPGYYKSQANFVREQYRRRGIFTYMLWCMMDKYRDKPIKADCLESSVRIYLKLGFELKAVKNCKAFTLYKVEYDAKKDVHNSNYRGQG